MKSGIYQIRNTVNNKIYVGSTVDFEFRKREHFYRLNKGIHYNKHLQKAWNKYGSECFEFEVLEVCQITFLQEKEQTWIDKLDAYNKGYNNNPYAYRPYNIPIPIAQLSLQGELIEIYPSIKETNIAISGIKNQRRDDIGACLRGKQKSAFGFQWIEFNRETFEKDLEQFLVNRNSILIEQIDLKTGECLKIFNGIREAEIALGKIPGNSTINHCLKGNYSQSYGYLWRRYNYVQNRVGEYYAAVDVGKSGAIVIMDKEGLQVFSFKIPLIGNEIDIVRLSNYFETWRGYIKQCIIEDVHSIYGTSAKSNFQFGRSLGILEGIISGFKIPCIKVAPKKWQEVSFQGIPKIAKPRKSIEKGHGSIDTKAMALIAAKRLYPHLDLRKSERSKKEDNGIVDALLMAHYAKVTRA